MSSINMVTNKRMHLDRNVWLLLLLTCIFSLALLSYSHITKESCKPLAIGIQGLKENGKYQVGDPVFFRTSSESEGIITWNFGDSTENMQSDNATVKHTFSEAGKFIVSATTDRLCPANELIVEVEGGEVHSDESKAPRIEGPASLKVGQSGTYYSDVVGATTYEWKILDQSTFPTITSQIANFTFNKSGLYRLQLTIDHDRNNKTKTYEINVLEASAKPLPPPPPIVFTPIKKKPKENTGGGDKNPAEQAGDAKQTAENHSPGESEISKPAPKKKTVKGDNSIFQTLLEGVVTGETSLKDFDDYLSEGGNTHVLANGKKQMSFSAWCQEVKQKKITIQSVDLKRNEAGDIIRIDIRYKGKGLLGLF